VCYRTGTILYLYLAVVDGPNHKQFRCRMSAGREPTLPHDWNSISAAQTLRVELLFVERHIQINTALTHFKTLVGLVDLVGCAFDSILGVILLTE
jgi:hypothetical protein